tara:strand:- start:106 stop:471 length:366 start_codon:yes stop_codon:yes gene_type:complete
MSATKIDMGIGIENEVHQRIKSMLDNASIFKTKNKQAVGRDLKSYKKFITLFLKKINSNWSEVNGAESDMKRIYLKNGTMIRQWSSYKEDEYVCLKYTIYKPEDMVEVGNGITVPKCGKVD